ncbi:MAG: ABC transporter ATP-binding protein [Ilumatobacter sp.]|uniref:ABC transporter ATP-binding protein n=1 Tax=Ilumatobacter sp. TaxID=1967498 RepID=UPI003C721667
MSDTTATAERRHPKRRAPDVADPSVAFAWRRVGALFADYRRRVAIVAVLVVVGAVLGIVNPLLIQRVFDDALFGADGLDLGLLWTLVLVMIGVAMVSGIVGVIQTVQTNVLGQLVLRGLRERLYRHLQTLSLSFFSGARTGDLQSRLSSDVSSAQNAVTSSLSSILSNGITFASALVAMFVLSWQLTVVTLLAVPLFVLATRKIGGRRERYTREMQVETAEMSTITQETLSVSGITLAKLFGRQDHEVGKFEGTSERLSASAQRQQVIGQAFFTVIQTFLGITPIVAYLAAGYALNGGSDLTAGTIVAFTTLQNRLFFPVARMLETFVELQSSRALFGRIFAYLDIEPEIVEAADAHGLDAVSTTGSTRFDGVHFHYPDTEVASLADITFAAEPGQLVAFVGPSGAGKSTILQLIARLYDPDDGTVSIDGHDLRDLTFESLARTVGFVTQESYLFAGSLRDNIAYGRPDATDTEVEEAGRAAAIHDRVMEFTDGYDTVVGERGFRLSGGERQRIAIARVLLSDPRVLVLDEATSALDTASERRIQEALGELISGRTTLAVAHRLSTIQAADVIHVIDRGRIVESGSHDELLAIGGVYADLYREQFGDGSVETECADGVVLADGSVRPHGRGSDEECERRLVRHRN